MASDDDIPAEDPVQFRVRFSSYVDQSIYELGLESFYSSGDGNCFYNSLSIVMSGYESDSEIFRLGAAMYGVAHSDHIVDAVRTIILSLGACLCGCLLYRNILIQLLEKFATVIFSDYLASNIRHFTDRGDTLQWAASVSLSPNEVQEMKDKSIQEIVAKRLAHILLNQFHIFIISLQPGISSFLHTSWHYNTDIRSFFFKNSCRKPLLPAF
ncbi:unnamed protein product [Pocillopora meandrina]|uniref:OTU domain-containing protein n=1 Tax=Pocillopora meandrina TaxID=46732 RepID=A0AAU9XKT5_9CNID|nr:unnamed protein product [Pocillopora meandrina]